MSIINCKAQNANTCRFHRPNAGAIAFASWKKSEVKLEEAKVALVRGDETAHSDFMDARYHADTAEEVYYGTNDGLISLLTKLETTSDPMEKYTLEQKVEIAKYHVQEQELANEIDNAAGGPLIPAQVADTYTPPKIFGGGNDLWPESKGSNYDSSLSNVKIKTLIGLDLKEAQKKGYLPRHVQLKLRASKGNISVKIIGVPANQIYNDPDEQRLSDMTPNARELKSRITTIVNSYNDIQHDHIEGRRNQSTFWENISYETDWEKQSRESR
jgi:hypothetical protein